MILLDKPDTSNINYSPPASPGWYTALLALPEDVQSQIKVNASVLRREIKGRRHVPLGEDGALELSVAIFLWLNDKAAK